MIYGLLFILFHLREWGSFLYNYIWGVKFEHSDYTWALDNFKTAQKFNNSETTTYNLWTANYKLKRYDEAQIDFENLLLNAKKPDIRFQWLFNLWNTYYEVGKSKTSTQDTIDNYKKSIQAYSQALEIHSDSKTKENKQYVENELKKLQSKDTAQKNSQSSQKDSQKSQGNSSAQNSWTGSENSQNRHSSTPSQSSNSQGNTHQSSSVNPQNSNTSPQTDQQSASANRDQKYQLQWGKEVQNLSEKEKQEIEVYKKWLQQFQQQNQSSFNIQDTTQDGQDIFWNPLFDTNLSGVDRDW